MRDYQTVRDELNTLYDLMFDVDMQFRSLQLQEARLRKELNELEDYRKALRRDHWEAQIGDTNAK